VIYITWFSPEPDRDLSTSKGNFDKLSSRQFWCCFSEEEAMRRQALLSVWDKTGIVEFAQTLVEFGFDIISTGGTAKVLDKAGVPVIHVQAVTKSPEMMGGRVKTMHPVIMGGILCRPDNLSDRTAMDAYGIQPIEIVAVNLYPFGATANDPTKTFDDLIENIDIGGPSMIRAAAKNFEHVLVVTSPADYNAVLNELELMNGPSMMFRHRLMCVAFDHTARHEEMIAEEMIAEEMFRFTQAVGDTCVRISKPDLPQMHDGTI